MNVCAHCLEGRVSAWAAIQFVRNVKVQIETCRKIGSRRVDLVCRRDVAIGTVALNPDKVEAAKPRAIEAEILHVGGCVAGNTIHNFVPHQRLSQRGYRIPGGAWPERPERKFRELSWN